MARQLWEDVSWLVEVSLEMRAQVLAPPGGWVDLRDKNRQREESLWEQTAFNMLINHPFVFSL